VKGSTRRHLHLGALLLVLLLLALLVAAHLFVRGARFQHWAAGRIGDLTQRDVRFSGAELVLFPEPGIRLLDVAIGGARDASPSRARSILCTLRIAPLLRGTLHVGSIVIEGPDLRIERIGDWAFEIEGAPPRPGLPADPASAEAADRTTPFPRLRLRDGNLTLVDRAAKGGPAKLRLTGLEVDLPPLHQAGPFRFSAQTGEGGRLRVEGAVTEDAPPASFAEAALQVEIRGAELPAPLFLPYLLPGREVRHVSGNLDASLSLVGSISEGLEGPARIQLNAGSFEWLGFRYDAPVTFEGSLGTGKEGLSVSGATLDAAHLAALDYAGRNARLHFDYRDRLLRVEELRVEAYGGTWSAHGSIHFGTPVTFDVEARAQGVKGPELLAALSQGASEADVEEESDTAGAEGSDPFVFDTVEAETHLKGRWVGAETLARHTDGSYRMTLRGGSVRSSALTVAVWNALVGRLPFVGEEISSRSPKESNRIDPLRASYVLRDGRLHTDDLLFVTEAYTLTGTGSMGFDGSVDYSTKVAFTAQGVQKLTVMASVKLPLRYDPHMPPIPVAMTGTLGRSLSIRPQITHVPLHAFRLLFHSFDDAVRAGIRYPLRAIQHGSDEASGATHQESSPDPEP
jgi:hypothetical protein